ncbi:hypothetical protein ACNHE5_16210 [Pandoraea pnomenusa]|jgi:hypothetical protein|uniref:hypothetical protein n=1 Tax=Pandoraea TaxID=93217 RepID=UPI0012BBEB6F|nr:MULTISPECIES: hypothetical protein [Pandoraea]
MTIDHCPGIISRAFLIKMPARGGQKSLQGKSRDMSGNMEKEFPAISDVFWLAGR